MMESKNIFFKPDEAKFLALAVISLKDRLEITSKDIRVNWTPETRKQLKEMLQAGNDLQIKLRKVLGSMMDDLPPYRDGDEEEFLTKIS